MDTTIQSLFNLRPPSAPQVRLGDLITNTKIGIEVEVEGMEVPPKVSGWRRILDGSLRNHGVEYVFQGPVGGLSACNRLKSLESSLAEKQPVFSLRTSVHVHLDVRDMTWTQVQKLILVYAMVEPYLFALCGQEREDNIYSMSLYRGQHQVSQLCDIFRLGPEAINIMWTKYTALNLTSIPAFGSLEFRGHRGTCSKDVIVNWVNHILALKEYAIDPTKLVDHLPRQLSTSGSHTLLSSIFGERLVNNNIWPHCSDALYESMWVAEDIIHHSPMIHGHHLIIENNQGSTQLDKVRDKLCVV